MSHSHDPAALPSLRDLDRAKPLERQLLARLRGAIEQGTLVAGERLPSSRALASSLGVARNTVIRVFDQLIAEGYLESRVGSGTRVVGGAITGRVDAAVCVAETPADLKDLVAIDRLAAVVDTLDPPPAVPFAVPQPATGVVPDRHWVRIGNRIRAAAATPSSYGSAFGEPLLREAIAGYLCHSRGVKCDADNVVITAGAQQAIYAACRVLLSPERTALVEDPAYPGLTTVLDDLGIPTTRARVDEQGMCPDFGTVDKDAVRVTFVTPSHQYPLGMPLSMARRQALVAWAQAKGGWIVEDDYDSELRYAGHPFPAMQGLCPERVLYLGTFSKVVFPALRMGYIIAPKALTKALAGARALIDRHSPTVDQLILAEHIRKGHFEAHIRRTRVLYGERRDALLDALRRGLPTGFEIQPSDQGMHVLVWLPPHLADSEVSRRLMSHGLYARPISAMYGTDPRQGLMLGFGAFPKHVLRDSAKLLCEELGRNG